MEDFNLSRRDVTSVSLAVELIDDLTGEAIKGSNGSVSIDGIRPPINKNDGWFVFTGLLQGKYTITANGSIFSEKKLRIELTGDEMLPLRIRLHPNKLYRPYIDCIRIEGKAAPGSMVYFFSEDKAAVLKILTDCTPGTDTISVFGTGANDLEGRLLRIKASKGTAERIRAVKRKKDDSAEYILEKGVKGTFPKVGTSVSPVTETQADENGRFMALIRKDHAGSNEIICQCGRKKRTIPLEGKNNIMIDLM